MKVLITGATGKIGSAALTQCLAHPDITSVVALTRRSLPENISSHAKLETVIMEDFTQWPPELLNKHADAKAMIWALGSFEGSQMVDFDWPRSFQEAMIKHRSQQSDPPAPFRYIHLSGKFVRQDQDTTLFFMGFHRRLKGRHEMAAIALAEKTGPWWDLIIVRPGGVVGDGAFGSVITALVPGMIQDKDLGAYMAFLAAGGAAKGPIIYNEQIVKEGREHLKALEGN
ncbi:hypothetical protein N7495_000766 [Penicillium taxi]|uniref:uncharacterized protein n=1 Tax=Penicillium taxi TaxID=168475 RepID=UPI0025450FE0|nr:uncharacterized protein N7495_000766 [Penicillium taxi]KAJ5908084.1 hypothetical protein N7495_000766 [Penicillium taxi]